MEKSSSNFNTMKLKFTILVFLIVPFLKAFSQQTINGFQSPESVTSDGHRFFVSSQGQDYISRDGDGYISEISRDGKMLKLKFAPLSGVLNAPKGLTISGSILFVADLDRVLGFNLNTGRTVFELTIPGAKMLNDICKLKNGFIAVTETISGNIYRINIVNKRFSIIGNVPTANGINYNENTDQLVVCTNGLVLGEGSVFIRTGNSPFISLPNITNGFFDGLEWVDDTHLLISDWVTFPVKGFGKLWIYDLKNKTTEMLMGEESIADIYYDKATSKIYMPQMLKNRVVITGTISLLKDFKDSYNNLFQYGLASAFIGGVYKGSLPIKDLKFMGDFGLGAPDLLDGELTILNGIVYQTKASGETTKLKNELMTPFAFTTFFKADTAFYLSGKSDEAAVLQKISSFLKNKNSVYALKITGEFQDMKTRAFPAVADTTSAPLVTLMDKQRIFDYKNCSGFLVGYHFPEYLNGINIAGHHFHYLSHDMAKGGHVLDFTSTSLKIEIAEIKSLNLKIPSDKLFQDFKFPVNKNESLEKIEKGKR